MQDGYHLKQTGPYTFSCQKLGQISVRIYGENSELLPSVLLSLSGEEGYRNNSISSSGGTFTFDNLFPGSFYLRPLLKVLCFSVRSFSQSSFFLLITQSIFFVFPLLNNTKGTCHKGLIWICNIYPISGHSMFILCSFIYVIHF
jgi:hypothetical protein